ncbi:HAD-IIIC family phosphatase [Paenibacillus thiaminolyticus]|uniref:HAD-IIIC family phosphatase n=1 Tax=Paenibacillus thiaminolyticus TaxID=49283 RepID=UPI002543230D|nr:HAD-IIIC family phosphatase [Paenibacillus thiaminolyticus]WII39464.1 HAD-IIIC family phosphatase [Paenibacillus thiaminolyticus]
MDQAAEKVKEVKCVVWDLDHTMWDGILLESGEVALKPRIREILAELDSRGILHSIASRNDAEHAMSKLREFGVESYFLYPEINWNAKSASIEKICGNLNIGKDTILFIDDQPFERDEVQSVHPEVACIDAADYGKLLEHPRLNPRFITEDSKRRRAMYIEDMQRKQEEEEFTGPQDAFLKSLGMRFVISEAREEDLKRAEELTVRTNQLNATGYTYSYEELDRIRQSPDYMLLVCELTDKYGSYGKIGLALIELKENCWHLKLLLMSCRVMSRGVGTVMLTHIMQQAKMEGKTLLADFKQTDRNKMMYVTYRFANFVEVSNDGQGNILFKNELNQIQPFPPYIEVKVTVAGRKG